MKIIDKLVRWLFNSNRDSLSLAIAMALDEGFEPIKAKLAEQERRASRYEGMGRLTHTQEILRAQALAKAEAYRDLIAPQRRIALRAAIVKEILK